MSTWRNLGCRKNQGNLNLFDLTTTGIGSSLAVGAFVVFGDLIKNITGPAALLSIALAGAAALLAGICLTELGVHFLKADSAYIFSYSFYKKHIAFVFGWILILQYVAGAASVGKGIIIFIDSLAENKLSNFTKEIASTNFDNVFVYFDFLSLTIIVSVVIIQLFNIKDCRTVKNIFTIFNIILVISVLIVGSFRVDVENWFINGSEDEMTKKGFMPFGILSVTKGATIAFYGFVGFENICVSGSDVKRRKKNMPIAVMTTIICLFLTYIGIASILTLMLPYYKLNKYAALPFAFEQSESAGFKWVIAIACFFGFSTSLFGVSFPLPRIIQGMGSDGLLFSFLGNNPLKLNISKTAILFGGLLTGAATGIFSFQLLINLTVLGALCVYTIVAINVILLRYSLKSENENGSEAWAECINKSTKFPIKAVIKNCIFKETTSTNLTEKIVVGNIILYCLSSIGLSVIYSVFSECLFKGSVEAVVPACVFLSLILLSLFSLIRQPKLQLILPLKVPFVPLLPCLSIFLNIFLMVTLDSVTWMLFSGWIVSGLLFHLVFQCLNNCEGNVGKDSLYEINKSNALKLNEAIWKINSEKKTFYEGAVNPVFTGESEYALENVKTSSENELKVHSEKAVLQLNQAEIIQTAELIPGENLKPLRIDPELEFVNLDCNSLDENNSVHWECVAEIHTEVEYPQESVVLEIVDNTYNFLSEEPEESPEDNVSQKSVDPDTRKSLDSMKESRLEEEKHLHMSQRFIRPPIINFQEELISKINSRIKTIKENTEGKNKTTEKISEQSENLEESETDVEFFHFVIDTLYEAPRNEMISRMQKKIIIDSNTDKETKILEEHNKIKEFKEKLNQLLKNQLSFGENPEKRFTILKSDENVDEVIRKKSEAVLFENIKTLNKSQIKGKLEILLANGPPKRPSFKNQFRNNLKEDEKSEKKKSQYEIKVTEESTYPSNTDIKSEGEKLETLTSNISDKKSSDYTETRSLNSACC